MNWHWVIVRKMTFTMCVYVKFYRRTYVTHTKFCDEITFQRRISLSWCMTTLPTVLSKLFKLFLSLSRYLSMLFYSSILCLYFSLSLYKLLFLSFNILYPFPSLVQIWVSLSFKNSFLPSTDNQPENFLLEKSRNLLPWFYFYALPIKFICT